MNHFTQLSIKYANQRSYLDDLFQVYPTIPEGIRIIDNEIWENVEKAFNRQNNDGSVQFMMQFAKDELNYD